MSVHYKFKSSLDYDTITFDGLHISVNDFRKAVIQQKRLGKTNDFELQITNAQTKEEYENDNDLIPKNTSLIISRIPQTSKKIRDVQSQNTPNVCHVPKFDSNSLDLSQMNASEEDKIQAMMVQSTADYDPRGYQKIRGPGQTGEVPPTYRCYKCHQTGHWIKNCPLPHSNTKKSEIRRNTGIPKSFLQEKNNEKQIPTEGLVLIEKKTEVPDELLCSICQDIFRDAVMIPCCGSSFCDDCVRTALLESEENECPDCKEKGTSPGSLIPNRFLRSSVNTFKNETGYERNKKNNGSNENVINTSEIATEKTTEESIEINQNKLATQEKNNLVKNNNVEVEDTNLISPKEECISLKNEDTIKTMLQEKEEFRKHSFIDRKSPNRRVEVVVPQREMSHSADIQSRPDDIYNQAFSNYGSNIADMPSRSNTSDPYLSRTDSFIRHPKSAQEAALPHITYCNSYDNRTDRYYYTREPYNINATPYPFLPNTRCRQAAPPSIIQPYYQGMSGTIESGIIEDPLEAFNRIMKEKEKRKEMKRLANERHRSNVIKRTIRDGSPVTEKRTRRASPLNERRNRSPLRQEKNSNHRNIEREKHIRNHRTYYSVNKRSFSRSNSPPQRRYSKSPRRRSRSKSHIRSHSREVEQLRYENKLAKRVSHRSDHDKDILRYGKKSLGGRLSESRLEPPVPKESKRCTDKMKENSGQGQECNPAPRKSLNEIDNTQESRNPAHEFLEKKGKIPPKVVDRKSKNNEDISGIVHYYGDSPKTAVDKKNRERKKKKEKEEKLDKRTKKDKKEKKKRERHKDEPKKHLEDKDIRRDPETNSFKNANEMIAQTRTNKRSSSRSPTEAFTYDGNDNFTPELTLSSNKKLVDFNYTELEENEEKLNENKHTLEIENSSGMKISNVSSEKNTPTSFIDTTPENYVGKWDNFDFSVPNSDDMKVENCHGYEFESHLSTKNKYIDTDKYCKNEEVNYSHINIDKKFKSQHYTREKGLDLSKGIMSKRSSRTPSEIASSTSNTSNVDKSSQNKKKRKKSKHKKGKRSSSAESLKRSISKHKRSKADKKKKTRRNDPH